MEIDGWVPIRLYWSAGQPWLDWCQMGDARLTEPFFDHAVENRFQDPCNLLFRKQTPIEVLSELEESRFGAEPNGFIFHMSRCGSTLAAQMLATLPASTVVSEPSIIESLFRSETQPEQVSDRQRITWLRGIVTALGRSPRSASEPFFIKFSNWNTMNLPLIQRAFPEVPWLFLYRNPVEVMVSLRRIAGRLVPGAINPAVLGLDLTSVMQMPAEEYHARVLAKTCNAAIECHRPGQAHFVNYQELPDIVWDLLPGFFDFACTNVEQKKMRERARFGGKNPEVRFSSDKEDKNNIATAAIREAADRWMGESFEKMEAIREARVASSGQQ